MDKKDLRNYRQEPEPDLFGHIQRRLRRRRAMRLTALTLLACVLAGGIWLTTSHQGEEAVSLPKIEKPVAVAMAEEGRAERASAKVAVTVEPEHVTAASPTKDMVRQTVAEEGSTEVKSPSRTAEPSGTTDSPIASISRQPERMSPASKEAETVPVATEPASAAEAVPSPQVEIAEEEDLISDKGSKMMVDSTILWVPNIIVPDGDEEKNRVFSFIYKAPITAPVSDFRVFIFNRGGRQLFTSTDPSFTWDGTFNGTRLPQGAYVWVAQFRDSDGHPHNMKGTVTLVR